jgi:hypothetical protein
MHPGVASCRLVRLGRILVVLLHPLGVLVLWGGLAHVLGLGLRDESRLADVHRPLRVRRPLGILGTLRTLRTLGTLGALGILGTLRPNCGRKSLLYRVQARPGVRLRTSVLALFIVVEAGVEGVLAVVEGKTFWLESGIHY